MPNPKLLVCHHDPGVFRDAEAHIPSSAVQVFLPSLRIPRIFQHNRFAENRILLAMALNPNEWLPEDGWVGMFHATYPMKFKGLPTLHALASLDSNQQPFGENHERVFCPLMTTDFLGQANSCHRNMDLSIERVFESAGITYNNDRLGPLTNSFIAHVKVWRRLLTDWLRLFLAAQDDGETLPFDTTFYMKTGVEPAYLFERLTTGWFTSQPDLQMVGMATKEGYGYVTIRPDVNPTSAKCVIPGT